MLCRCWAKSKGKRTLLILLLQSTFGFARGATGVKDEEGVLRRHPLYRTDCRGHGHSFMPPDLRRNGRREEYRELLGFVCNDDSKRESERMHIPSRPGVSCAPATSPPRRSKTKECSMVWPRSCLCGEERGQELSGCLRVICQNDRHFKRLHSLYLSHPLGTLQILMASSTVRKRGISFVPRKTPSQAMTTWRQGGIRGDNKGCLSTGRKEKGKGGTEEKEEGKGGRREEGRGCTLHSASQRRSARASLEKPAKTTVWTAPMLRRESRGGRKERRKSQ